jgi:hypothetical protein
MGHWTTLHLFSDKIFTEKTVTELKGETGNLREVYRDFLKTHTIGGINRFNEAEIREMLDKAIKTTHLQSKKFDGNFRKHIELDAIKDDEAAINFLHSTDWYYEFSRFFEYYVFYTCADFFPHLPCGKWGIRNLDAAPNSLANELLTLLNPSRPMFACDFMGIIGWLTSENVELLFCDKDRIRADNSAFLSAFLNILTIAYDNKLGLLFGCDLREDELETLPQFKLIEKESSAVLNSELFLFKR